MTRVYLGLGSNRLPESNLSGGLKRLKEAYQVVGESPWYRSPAMGFDGPEFINLVVALETDVSPSVLSGQLKQLEFDFGRPLEAKKFSSRNLDIDILLYGDWCGEFGHQQLPRKDIYQYAFVLRPLLDLAPTITCPKTGRLLSEYWLPMAHQPLYLLTDEPVALPRPSVG